MKKIRSIGKKDSKMERNVVEERMEKVGIALSLYLVSDEKISSLKISKFYFSELPGSIVEVFIAIDLV